MFFQRIKTPALAHNAYILGASGKAVVVDPRRDVTEYLRIARDNGLFIEYVLETHRQEDFVMGAAELARAAGAKIVNGDHPLFGHGDIRLRDGEELQVGPFVLRALHTPGHTPESTSYAIFLDEAPGRAFGVFTGDALFVGGTGRVDLASADETDEHAGLLYDVVHQKILPLGGQALIFPAHGKGSICGVHIGDRDESTLGFERAYNPVFIETRDAFIHRKLREHIPRPPYFSRTEELNLEGGARLARDPAAVPLFDPSTFAARAQQGIIIDTRSPEAFAGGHIPGSLSVWRAGLGVFGGFFAGEDTPVLLVLDDPSDLESAALALARLGIDNVVGALAGGFEAHRDEGLPIGRSGTLTPRELVRSPAKYTVLDVRDQTEVDETGLIHGARHVYVGHLDELVGEALRDVEKDDPIAVTCSVGNRASLGASILLRHGYTRVFNLLGGMTAWIALDLPRASREEKKAA